MFAEQMKSLFTMNNMTFLFEGLGLTLYIAFIAIIFSMIFGTLLAVFRSNQRLNILTASLKVIATLYIEIVRNIPNLLWIFVVFLIFRVESVPAGIISFTLFTSAALAEIIRGGITSVDSGEIEAAYSQGFRYYQILWLIILPQAFRNMAPAIVSQFVTVIKDTSFLYTALALHELLGKANILMGRYTATSQVFMIYALVALLYFLVNFSISLFSRYLSRKMAAYKH